MLGRDHALLGAVAYLGAAPEVAHLTHTPLPPVELAVGTVVSAAFALLPDIDEPHSLVSTKLGPVSEAVSRFTNRVAGGHRHATHSLLFVALVGAGLYGAGQWRWTPVVAVVLSGLLVMRIILPFGVGRSGLLPLVLVAGAGWWAAIGSPPRLWLALTAAGGVFLHLVGDALTIEGVPLLWPAPWRVKAPVLGHTDSGRERALATLMGAGIAALLWFSVISPTVQDARTHDWQRTIQTQIANARTQVTHVQTQIAHARTDVTTAQHDLAQVQGGQ